MSSWKIFLRGVLLFALQKISSPTATVDKFCHYWMPLVNGRSFAEDCAEINLDSENITEFNVLSNISFTNLMDISLCDNKIIEMPILSVSVKNTLKTLLLTDNKIASVPDDYFSGFENLTMLSLAQNELTKMPPLTTKLIQTLQKLWLSDNNISSIPMGYFHEIWNLEQLSLASNELSQIPMFPESVKKNLEKLYVDGNKITAIPDGYFSGFSALSILSLNGNKISRFPPGTSLRHLSNLSQLRIDQMDCDCATLGAWQQIASMRNIYHMVIYKNEISIPRFPCGGDLSYTHLLELGTKVCNSTTAPPMTIAPRLAAVPPSQSSIASGVGGIKYLIFAIGILSILAVAILT